ncbi:hypothetical protein KVV02_006671 [Mortierella alpina]|uniref:Uncharacterized protein n=1 Tax=Mortierella alpina TaxID=64518 RepID=A0A9P8CX92_MORAP|nr:hypothetical protein KVV02_006671 [Mortierella alpina]
MTSRQQRYMAPSQIQDGHPIPNESSEWNPYSDQAMAPPTPTGSTFKRWTTTDQAAQPSSYPSSPPYHPHHMPQLPPSPHHSAMPVSPSRKSFSSAIKHKSSNNTGQHTGANYGYNSPAYRSSHHQGSDYYGSPPQHPPASTMSKIPTYQSQHRATIADASFSSTSRTYLKDPNLSPSLMQSMDAFSTPHVSPRMAPKPPPRRREQPQPAADGSELPSLDQYEAMLQQMTSPAGSPKEPRQRRNEHASDRSSRRMTRQGRKQQQLVSEELNTIAVPASPSSITDSRESTSPKNKLVESLSERKHRRRSSMPTFGDFPIRALTELKRRSSEYRIPAGHPSSALAQGAGSLVNGSTESSMRSWVHNNSMPPVKGSMDGRGDPQNGGSNKRSSRRLSPTNVRSTRRLSHALAPPENDYFTVQHSPAKSDFSLDEGDRRIEQYQMELRQLQGNGIKSPNIVAARVRTATDEGSSIPIPIPIPPPSRQQLLASLGDGSSSKATSPNRSTTPTSPKPRPTTPVRPAPPPSGLSPMSITSAPIILTHGTSAPSPNNNANNNHNKKNPPGAASARRIKPTSAAAPSPAAPRSRAASVASVNSMNSMASNFHMDGVLNQAPPSLPLPSVPSSPASPASISSTTMSIAASAAPSNFALLPPSSQFMSAELEEMALLSSANSRTGLVAEVEALKLQLIERDETIYRMTTAERQQEHAQQQQLRTLTEEALVFKRELALLDEARSRLEASLAKSEQERQVQQDRYQQLEQAFEQFKVVGSKDRQQQDDEHWALQETVQRLTAQISDLEDQHASEMQRLQQDHDELLETVVLKHAGALTDLSEQAKTDYEQRLVLVREDLERQFRQDHQELLSRERVLQSRWEEQSRRGQRLQEGLFRLEQNQATHEEEKETWRQTNKSLERQLAMEHLQQQENMYRIETVEKENRRLLEILADLDLTAITRTNSTNPLHDNGGGDGDVDKVVRAGETLDPQVDVSGRNDNDNDQHGRPSKTEIVALYESQRQRWKDQTQLLERKMAKSEEEATAIMQKNMELMVALEMAQTKPSN